MHNVRNYTLVALVEHEQYMSMLHRPQTVLLPGQDLCLDRLEVIAGVLMLCAPVILCVTLSFCRWRMCAVTGWWCLA
jgi:hypothetical protein